MQNEKFSNGTKDAVFVDTVSTSENVFDGKKAGITTTSTKIDSEKIAAVETGKLKQKLDNTQYVRIPRGEDYSVLIPVEEYLDKEAAKLGFESYAAMRAEGLSIDTPPLVDRHSNPVNLAENKSSSFLTVNSNAFETAPERAKDQINTIGKLYNSENGIKDTIFDADSSKEQIQQPTHTHLPAAKSEIKTGEIAVPQTNDSFTVTPAAQFQNPDAKSSTTFDDEKKASPKHSSRQTDVTGKESDIYVYYDSKSKEKAGPKEKFTGTHEKQAIRQHGTDVGGGAVFTAHYAKNGTLKTDISLNTGKNRTETKGFVDKSLTFVDETQRFVNRMPKGEEGSFEEVMDSSASSTLEHLAGKALENRGRYKKIRKDVQIDHIRQEGQKDRHEQRQRPARLLLAQLGILDQPLLLDRAQVRRQHLGCGVLEREAAIVDHVIERKNHPRDQIDRRQMLKVPPGRNPKIKNRQNNGIDQEKDQQPLRVCGDFFFHSVSPSVSYSRSISSRRFAASAALSLSMA